MFKPGVPQQPQDTSQQAITTAVASAVAGLNSAYAEIYLTNDQAVSAGTTVTVEYDSVYLDTDGLWDITTHQLTIPASLEGKVMLFHAGVQHTADGTGDIELHIDGSSDAGGTWYVVSRAGLQGEQFGIIECNGFEQVVTGNIYRVQHFSSAAKTIDAAAGATQFKATVMPVLP